LKLEIPMKSYLLTLFALLLSLLAQRPARAELRVVTTTPDLAAIVSAVGGARVKMKTLALPTQDPH